MYTYYFILVSLLFLNTIDITACLPPHDESHKNNTKDTNDTREYYRDFPGPGFVPKSTDQNSSAPQGSSNNLKKSDTK